jgi:integral membrane protein
VKGLVTVYRVLAFVVGILLAFCSLVALPLKYAHSWFGLHGTLGDGGGLQRFGEQASIMWLFHGWVFLIYLVVAFLLARRAGWTIQFTVLMIIAGLVPLLIFWVERRVVHRLEAENPDLTGVAHSQA